jgi:hypothetical protein
MVTKILTKTGGDPITSSNRLGVETGDFIVTGSEINILDALRWGIRCGGLGVGEAIRGFLVIGGVELDKLVTRVLEDNVPESLIKKILYKGNMVNTKPVAVKIILMTLLQRLSGYNC